MNKKIVYSILFILAVLLVFSIFVPVFSGKLAISPTVNFGWFSFRWYGLILAIAVLVGFLLARKNSWKFGIGESEIDNYSFWLVIFGLVSARLYYILPFSSYYFAHLSEIYKIWHGGLSIFGAIIGGVIFTFFYCRKKAYTFYQLADSVVLGLPVAQAVGRLGNFFNQEAFGMPTNLPWKMYVQPDYRPVNFMTSNYFHPTFLYEMIWSIIVFFVLGKMVGRVKSGAIFALYLILYSLGRFMIEPLRLDSSFVLGLRLDQAVAGIFVLVGLALFLRRQKVV